jgi:hypothetical protein
MVLTGSPCQNFPRPRPKEGPDPSAGITTPTRGADRLTAYLSTQRIDIIDDC